MNRPTRIMMVISDLSGGGAEREFATLARHLYARDFDVHVCLWRNRIAYALPREIPRRVLGKERPWHIPRAIRETARCMDTIQPDTVFSMLQFPNLVTGTALNLARKKPRWICRFVNPPEAELRGVKRAWARRVLPRADRILGCSDGLCRALLTHLNLHADHVETVLNPIDAKDIEREAEAETIEHPEDRLVLVVAGRLVRHKHVDVTLLAVAKMPAPRPEVWVLGEGPDESRLRRLVSRLNLSDSVRWLGFRTNPYPFMRAADCLVLSSEREGLPNVIVEAMLCGTPVVAARCPYGPEEMIDDGNTGFLVPVHDVNALAGVLARLAAKPTAASRMAENARAFARKTFASGTVLDAYERLLKRPAETVSP